MLQRKNPIHFLLTTGTEQLLMKTTFPPMVEHICPYGILDKLHELYPVLRHYYFMDDLVGQTGGIIFVRITMEHLKEVLDDYELPTTQIYQERLAFGLAQEVINIMGNAVNHLDSPDMLRSKAVPIYDVFSCQFAIKPAYQLTTACEHIKERIRNGK